MRHEKGWFQVPGIRPNGDRSLEEQLLGLEDALAECKGKTVLDLGCAEGMIAREFAAAGAAEVFGIELLNSHLEIARKVNKNFPQVKFQQANLGDYIVANPQPKLYDIVLALGIIHKLPDPNVPMLYAARSARSLLCFRAPAKGRGNGLIKSKFSDKTCHVANLMVSEGFVDCGTHDGVRGEAVQYWRRKA